MTRILLDEVTPGMVLDEPVKNSNGGVLLPSGATLTEKHIRAMKMWGIMDVGIQSEQDDTSPESDDIDPALLEKAKHQLEPIFRHVSLNEPVMEEIFTQAAIRHARSHS